MPRKKPRRQQQVHRGGVTGGGAYKKGERFKILPVRTDQVSLGIVGTTQDLAAQYQLMLALKTAAAKQLRQAQQTAQKLEKREHLLEVVNQVDVAVERLEKSLGALQDLAARFVIFAVNSREALVVEAQKFS